MNKLIGIITNNSAKIIKTKWYWLNAATDECREVTKELYEAIQKYNRYAEKSESYRTKIPYKLKDGVTEYSFGCGLSHYFNGSMLSDVQVFGGQALSFNLNECRMSMYTQSDVKHILGCKDAWDEAIPQSLLQHA